MLELLAPSVSDLLFLERGRGRGRADGRGVVLIIKVLYCFEIIAMAFTVRAQ